MPGVRGEGQRWRVVMRRWAAAIVWVAGGGALWAGGGCRVVDARTGSGIAGAVVTVGREVSRTGAEGRFRAPPGGGRIGMRAAGYRRGWMEAGPEGCAAVGRLEPFRAKALYLTGYGLGVAGLREPALRLIETTELNALVIDVKGDRGWISYPSEVGRSVGLTGQRVVAAPRGREMVQELRSRGVYLIGRIDVFKDDPMARARPEWAVKRAGGECIWTGRG